MDEVRILVVAAMHKRPLISELWILSVMNLVEKANPRFNIGISAIVSDDESAALCEKYGISFVRTVAEPVGKKFNQGFELLIKNNQFDYLLLFGDDDVFSAEILDVYSEAIDNNVPYFGINSVYFLDVATYETMAFKYAYKVPKLMGCARMFRRDVLIKSGYRVIVNPRQTRVYMSLPLRRGVAVTLPEYQANYMIGMKVVDQFRPRRFALWRDDQVNGLDHESEMGLLISGFLPQLVETPKPIVTDVKSMVNIWSYEHFRKISAPVPFAEATRFFTQKQIELLESLHQTANKKQPVQ